MTTAMSTVDRLQPLPERRKPRMPMSATLLLLAWLVLFVGGIAVFVYFIIAEAEPGTGQARLQTGGKITIAAIFASWPLLVLRARVLQRVDRTVKGARGAVCLNCRAVLTKEGREGTCPRCGEAFTLEHVRDVWNKHTP